MLVATEQLESTKRLFNTGGRNTLRRDLGRRLDLYLDARELLVELADLERRERLEESRAVVRAGAVAHLDHLLRELAVELRRRVREVGLDVDLCVETSETTP